MRDSKRFKFNFLGRGLQGTDLTYEAELCVCVCVGVHAGHYNLWLKCVISRREVRKIETSLFRVKMLFVKL